MGIYEGLVPLGLSTLLHCFSPPFTLITRAEAWPHKGRACFSRRPYWSKNNKNKKRVDLWYEIDKKKYFYDLTFYQAGSTSWHRGSEVVRQIELAGLWLEGRWQSTDDPLCRTTAWPRVMCEGRWPLSVSTISVCWHVSLSVLFTDTHGELSRQYQRKVSEGPRAGRGHHWYRRTIHLLRLKGARARWGLKRETVNHTKKHIQLPDLELK